MTEQPQTMPLLTIDWDTVIGTERLGYNPDTDEVDEIPLTLGMSVADLIARRLIDGLREAVRTAVLDSVTDTINAEAQQIVREQLAMPLQKTNTWGEPQGHTQTLRELLAEQVATYLNEKPRENRPGYSDHQRNNGFRELVQREVDAAMSKELKGEIDKARASVRAEVARKAGEMFGDVVKQASR